MPLVVGRTVNQRAGFQIDPIAAGRGKIVGQTAAEIARLPDIDDLSEPIPDEINAGFMRYFAQLLLECNRLGMDNNFGHSRHIIAWEEGKRIAACLRDHHAESDSLPYSTIRTTILTVPSLCSARELSFPSLVCLPIRCFATIQTNNAGGNYIVSPRSDSIQCCIPSPVLEETSMISASGETAWIFLLSSSMSRPVAARRSVFVTTTTLAP